MTNEIFTASNGIVMVERTGNLIRLKSKPDSGYAADRLAGYDELNLHDIEALREYFQVERDRELGRWRWPGNSTYVVYELTRDKIRVVNESTGNVNDFIRGSNFRRSDSSLGAAVDYFEAHPAKKPWHDAKPGEVWELTLDGLKYAALYSGEDRWTYSLGGEAKLLYNPGGRIQDAKRIWPEEVVSNDS